MPAGGRLTKGKRYSAKYMTPHYWDVMQKLEAFCAKRGCTLLQLAFAWLSAQPVVPSIIAGATSPEQLEANAKAIEFELAPDDLKELDTISPGPRAA
jgi:aryl-alcohol dehydrogenase-like predicted oxidoreductase